MPRGVHIRIKQSNALYIVRERECRLMQLHIEQKMDQIEAEYKEGKIPKYSAAYCLSILGMRDDEIEERLDE